MAALAAAAAARPPPRPPPPPRLLLPRRSGGRLAAMCGREGGAREELVTRWVRAIHDLAWPPAAAWGRPAASRGVEDSSSSPSASSSAPAAADAAGTAAAGTGASWPPDLTWDREVLRRALQRPSAFDEELDEEPPRRYTLTVDEQALLRFAGPGRRLIVSWTTGGPKRYSIARNLALSIRRNCGPDLERIFVFVALDRDAFSRAQADGFQVVLNEDSKDLKDDIWKMRWLIQTTCLSLGLEVLVVDSDIVFLRDPFEHFHFDADLEAMTDHFFPKRQLFATWLRPAEHINTGFLFARPSPTLIAHLVDFIDRHYYEYFDRHLFRDGMDQRAYNRFVMEKMEAEPPAAFAVYEDRAFEQLDWQTDPERTSRFTPKEHWRPRPGRWGLAKWERRVKIRLLDPREIAHGMNYFWRRAHRLRPSGSRRPPAVAHVNGVDPKQYFLRDRNVWYIDDWEERFGDGPSFLTYHHPGGLNLKDDFEHLMAAIEVAAYFRRRVVLPDTMNCANSPAYEVWRMNESLRGEGCTYDYFAHANGLYEVYSRVKPFSVEAGLGRTERFLELLRASSRELPGLEELLATGRLREEILQLQSQPTNVAAFGDARVLQLPASIDVRDLRDGLRRGDFGFRMNPQRIFSCAYQQILNSAMACLDENYVEEFGADALQQCQAVPQGCGPVGICCCWPFWGYGEKLQYFTGVPWNLPCNCGLDLCEGYDRNSSAGQGAEHCCRHAGDPSPYPNVEAGVFPCREPGQWQGETGAEDAHTYSTASLSDFLKGKRTAAQTFRTCRRDRAMRRGDYYHVASLRECNLQISAFLLREEGLEQAKVWWDWVLQERRGLGSESLLIPALDGNGTETDNTGFTVGKLRHDTEQLNHLANGGSASGLPGLPAPWRAALDAGLVAAEVAPAFAALLRSFEAFSVGDTQREEVVGIFPSVRPFFNRALYVPDVAMPEGTPVVNGHGREVEFAAAARSLREEGMAVLDNVLTTEALMLVRELFADSTVWYASDAGGSVLKARLRDGLHARLGLQLARELRERWLPDVLAAQPLLDIWAQKWDPSAPDQGLPARREDGAVALAIWPVDGPSGLASSIEGSGGGLRIYDTVVPADSALGEARKPLDASSAQGRLAGYRSNRAVLWRAPRAYEALWEGSGWPEGYERRRVDWIFNFGQSQVHREARKRGGAFVPTLEGREDSWGGHYYALDHDHR